MNNINDKQERRHFYGLVFSLVLPMALQNLINVGVSMLDVVMLGRVGETSLSAASLANQLQFILSLFLFGLTSGASILTAQYWGRKDTRTIEKVMAIAMRLALVVAIVFAIVIFSFPVAAMKIFSGDPEVIKQGAEYLRVISFSYIFAAITVVYLNIMRSVERVIISTIVYLVSLIVNFILNSILIFGLLGFPAMGIRGAAIATLIARIAEFLIVFCYAKFRNRQVRFHVKDLLVRDRLLMKDFLVYSIPVMLNEIVWGTGTAVVAAVIGHLGTSVVAANSVAQVTRQLATVIAFGLANAAAVICGKALGEGKSELAKLYAGRLLRITIVMGVIGIFVILGASGIAKLYLTLSDEAESYLSFMMIVMSYFTFCQTINATLIVGVFRAGGDANFGLIIDTVFLWGFSIFLGMIAAFALKLPIRIVYMIIVSDEVIKLPIVLWRYKSAKWVKNITR